MNHSFKVFWREKSILKDMKTESGEREHIQPKGWLLLKLATGKYLFFFSSLGTTVSRNNLQDP
uniref:Uncharacterized protein n=1 Tax=Anguilla anguilla TaxID=7936 RepID=A0A0E9XG06_ANGAN